MPDLIDVRDRDLESSTLEQVDLEGIWSTPYPPVESPSRLERIGRSVGPRLGKLVAFGWIVFIASVFFEPAPNPGSVTPLWADLLIASFFFALGTAGILGALRSGRLAYGAASIAGLLGIGLAISCVATDHHPVGWWSWELAATSVLTVLAGAGFRRSRS